MAFSVLSVWFLSRVEPKGQGAGWSIEKCGALYVSSTSFECCFARRESKAVQSEQDRAIFVGKSQHHHDEHRRRDGGDPAGC